MNLLHLPELILDCTAVATITWTPPCHNASVSKKRRESKGRGSDLLDVPQLLSNPTAVAPKYPIAPGDDSTSNTPQGKGPPGCSNLWPQCHREAVAIQIRHPVLTIQEASVRCSKAQERLVQDLLRGHFEVADGCTWRKGDCCRSTTWQGDVKLDAGRFLSLVFWHHGNQVQSAGGCRRCVS